MYEIKHDRKTVDYFPIISRPEVFCFFYTSAILPVFLFRTFSSIYIIIKLYLINDVISSSCYCIR